MSQGSESIASGVFDRIFNPKSVAVIGASPTKGSVGQALVRNLIGSDYDGIVYPVNPKRESILGVKVYPSVADTPDQVDLVIIATPASTVPGIVKQCGEAGVAGIVIVSAGFKEMGVDGEKACEQILELGRSYGMRIIGPNCLGFMNPSVHLNASFAGKTALPGKIAFISQSGALCTAILDWSFKQNLGFSYFVSIGSMIDVNFGDLIDYFGQDPGTSSIVIYMESLADARRFMSAARAYARNKPIIVLKAGRSSEGARAAQSHTGSLAGNDAVFDAAFKRAGVIRVRTIEELFNCAQTLAMQKRLIIPNERIDNMSIINYSITNPKMLCRVEIRVSYDTDLDLASRVMVDEATKCPHRDTEADEPWTRVVEHEDFGVKIRIYMWVPDIDAAWLGRFWLLENIRKRLAAESIEIPVPYRTIVQKKELPSPRVANTVPPESNE